ncbi:MAG: T9SS type A sorting domain-containing protein, partial [Chitinophagales bacterium]
CGSSYQSTLAQQAAVIRTDSLGNIIWAKDFGGTFTDGAIACLITNDSNIIVIGVKDGLSSTDSKIWIFFLDQNGIQIRTNETRILSGSNTAESIEKCNDGGYIVAGSCNTMAVPEQVSFLLKLDSLGNIEWAHPYGTGTINSGYDAIETFDGGFVLAGGIGTSSASSDVFLFKVDSAGTTLWADTIGTSNAEGAFSVKQTVDSNIVVAGNSYNFHDENIFLATVTNNGALLWMKEVGDSLENTVNCLQITSDGNIMLAGTTAITSSSHYQALLFKLDTQGDTIWVKNYGGPLSEFSYFGIETRDGGFALTGQVSILQPPHNAMYFVKVDQNGSTTQVNHILIENRIVVFPNPASELINIHMQSEFKKRITYELIDISGRSLITGSSSNSFFSVNIQSLAKGIYFIILLSDNEQIIKQFIKY